MTLEVGNCYGLLVYTYCLSVNVSAGTDIGRGSLKQYSDLQLLLLWGLSDQSLWTYGHAWGKSPRHA